MRRDKRFDSLARLQGASVSLVDPASTSGALVPRHAMAALTGMPLERYFGRLTFSGSHDRAIEAVHKGFVDATIGSQIAEERLKSLSLLPQLHRLTALRIGVPPARRCAHKFGLGPVRHHCGVA